MLPIQGDAPLAPENSGVHVARSSGAIRRIEDRLCPSRSRGKAALPLNLTQQLPVVTVDEAKNDETRRRLLALGMTSSL